MLKAIPHDYFNQETGTLRILTEEEWRGLGITQSLVGPITKLMPRASYIIIQET